MKTLKNQSITLVLSLLFCSFFTLSCKKDSEEFGSGPATVKVTLVGIEADVDNPLANNSLSKVASTSPIQEQPPVVEIPLDKNLSVYVSLEEQGNNQNNSNPLSAAKNKVAAKEVGNLVPGVKYGVIVYDASGDFVDHKVFTHGNEALESGFALGGGKTYTFIGYSDNSTTIPTEFTGINKLSTVSLDNISGDLLYFRQVQTVNTGVNNLRIMLRHKFTLITTQLKVGATYEGVINAVSTGLFTNLRESGSIKLADSTITYSSDLTSQDITFSGATFPTTTINSTPNLIIAPNTDAAVKFQIPNLTVNGISHVIPATSFNMKAGKKYNLVLTLDVPCYVNNTFSINNSGGITLDTLSTDIIYRTDKVQPLIIDFNNIDNNFNIIYNNKPLFEARFKTVTTTRTMTRTRNYNLLTLSWGAWGNWSNWSTVTESSESPFGSWTAHDAILQNNPAVVTLQFNSGGHWGNGVIPAIYNIDGTTDNPTVRVMITGHGASSITGKKSNTGAQENIVAITAPTISSINNTNIDNHIYNGSAPTISTSTTQLLFTETETRTETRTNMRKVMEFRKTTNLPVNPSTHDEIRIRQSTRHILPKAAISTSELTGTYLPRPKLNCTSLTP